jgi:hypothetical protein
MMKRCSTHPPFRHGFMEMGWVLEDNFPLLRLMSPASPVQDPSRLRSFPTGHHDAPFNAPGWRALCGGDPLAVASGVTHKR